MKKMLLLSALFSYYRMCSTDVYCSKQTSGKCFRNIPIISSFLELGRENCRCSQNLWRRRKCYLNRNPANIRKWIAQFPFFRAFILRWKRVCMLTIVHELPIDRQLYLHCSLILLLGSFQLFLHSDQPLSEGEIIPFSGVCQSGGGCIIHAAEAGSFALTDRLFDVQPTMTASGNIIRRASFSALASANSFIVCIGYSNITLTHLHVSNCRVRQLRFSGIFVALGFVGNGVIHGSVNSRGRQTMMQITRAEIIAVKLCSYINLSDRSARFFEFCNQAVSLMLQTTITAPVKPRYCCNGRLPDQITTINHR